MQVYPALLIIEFISTLYIFRWVFLPTKKLSSNISGEIKINYLSIPKSMMIPMYLLAVLVIASAVAYVTIPSYLGLVFQIQTTEIVVETIVIAVSLIAAYIIFSRQSKARFFDSHKFIYRAIYNSMLTNAFYLVAVKIVSYTSHSFDSLEYGLYRFIRLGGSGAVDIGIALKRLVDGQPNTYLIMFILGIALIILVFAL